MIKSTLLPNYMKFNVSRSTTVVYQQFYNMHVQVFSSLIGIFSHALGLKRSNEVL